MTRFLLLLTLAATVIFAGVVCSGCGDSSPVPLDAGHDAGTWPPVCADPIYVSTCDNNSAALCWRLDSVPLVTGCLVDVCPSGAHPTKGCEDAARVPCVDVCPERRDASAQ